MTSGHSEPSKSGCSRLTDPGCRGNVQLGCSETHYQSALVGNYLISIVIGKSPVATTVATNNSFSAEYSNPHAYSMAKLRYIRGVKNTAFTATPNRFKGIRPSLKPMPTAAWINPPTDKRKPTETAQPCTVNL